MAPPALDSPGTRRSPSRESQVKCTDAELSHSHIGELLVEDFEGSPPVQHDPSSKQLLKRRRSFGDSEHNEAGWPGPKRVKSSDHQISRADSVPFWGVQAIKPLTETNLRLMQDTMSPPDQNLSRRSSAKHRRVAALGSSKRSRSKAEESTEPSTEGSGSTRAYAPTNPRFGKCLEECGLDKEGMEQPHQAELDTWRTMMMQPRNSPDPDDRDFYDTRDLLVRDSKNETSVTKRFHGLSPMLFPYRDLPSNNENTRNIVYYDDALWSDWGSIKPGFLPTPKPDLCLAFKRSSFTSNELERLESSNRSPYPDGRGYAPSLTLEFKTALPLTLEFKTALQGLEVAEKQNANNIIPLLQADYALHKTNGTEKSMEKKIRFISSTHDTNCQTYTAWYYVLDSNGEPKWCSYKLYQVAFDGLNGNGFKTARQINLNLSEYISNTVFSELRQSLAGDVTFAPPASAQSKDLHHLDVAHLNTPSDSSAEARG